MASEQQRPTIPPHVTWDEETIALHDAERGTRMKIDEPKTPFHYYGSDGEDRSSEHDVGGIVSPARSLSGKEGAPPIEWSELEVKLASVKDAKEARANAHTSEWDSSDDETTRFAPRDSEGKKIEKDPKFAAKRKSHYNEFEQMKMWRASHPSDDDDEDDDEDEAHEKSGGGKTATQ